MTSIPFFFKIWEEYYTNKFILDIINGPSEGSLIACIAMCVTGYTGRSFWMNTYQLYGYTIQYNHTIVFGCFAAGVFLAFQSFFNVIVIVKNKKEAIRNLYAFLLLVASLAILLTFSNSQLIQKYPKLIVIVYGFSFAKLVTHLMLAHLSSAPFDQWRKSLLLAFFSLPSITILNIVYNEKVVDLDKSIICVLILEVVVWIHLAYFISEELCQILGINRFSTKKRLPAAIKAE
jgi:ethanolaminephosphotransferase